MLIRVLGAHNCESRNSRLVSLLIDDVLALDAGSLTSSLSFRAQLKLKAVLLTHHHYDHIRDIPALAMNFYLAGNTINIYSISPVYEALSSNFFNGKLYPDFLERPTENPAVKFTEIKPLQAEQIEGYRILAVPVNHSVTAVGYQVTSPEDGVLFYTGDTGPGLAECWEKVSPQLLIIEVTASNRFSQFGRESGHLTPDLLRQELISFREIKGYLPRVVTVHMNPGLEEEITTEIAVLARELNNSISLGYEGMELNL